MNDDQQGLTSSDRLEEMTEMTNESAALRGSDALGTDRAPGEFEVGESDAQADGGDPAEVAAPVASASEELAPEEPASEGPASEPAEPGDADPVLARALEALLIATNEPLISETLTEIVGASLDQIEATFHRLAAEYEASGRGFQLRRIAGGWQLGTCEEMHEVVAAWVVEGQHARLSQAAMETLAVIAYAQPTSRSKVAAVRGVNVDSVVRTLIARGLVEQSGTDDETGAGLLTTTPYFLQRLGLDSLADLPPIAPHLPEASDLEMELARISHEAVGRE